MDEEKVALHPVVELFLCRAKSHPKEVTEGKWDWVVATVYNNGSPQEIAAVEPVVKKLKLDNAHKNFMRELLNPEPAQGDLFKDVGTTSGRFYGNSLQVQQQIQQEYEMRKIQQAYEDQLRQQRSLHNKTGKP